MKKLVFILALALNAIVGFSQEKQPVDFKFTQERINDKEVLFRISAHVSNGAKLYSIVKENEDLPFSTVSFDTALVSKKMGETTEKANVQKVKEEVFEGAETMVIGDSVVWEQKFSIPASATERIKGEVAYMVKEEDAFNQYTVPFSVSVKPEEGKKSTAAATGENSTEEGEGERTLAGIMLIAFLAGIGTVFTPCVFPLIPVTVGFFTKRSQNKKEGIRNSVWYSLSIILIYTIPTFILTAIFGDSILYQISSSTAANLLFFAVFIFFAVSFFGAFEITLPGSWATAVDGKAGKGGFIGIFFMALTLVIVSFSCTGPIMSSLVTGTASQGVKFGTAGGMLAFSFGLALPFSLFAFFPSLMNAMPKAGGWLNSVKVVFGFLELALALKFLSNADLANHWGLLDREVFLALWIVIFGLLGLYLLGKLKFSHDSPMPYLGVPRLFLAIFTLSFTMYLVPGLWGAPLNFLSGLLPHTSTQDFNLNEIRYELKNLKASGISAGTSANAAKPPQKYIDLFHVPFGLTAYYDKEEALAASKATGKPIMIDFTGHSCANCRKMENEVWSKPEVLSRLSNDFIILSLYVDDKTELEDEEIYTSSKDGAVKKTIGDKNLDYEYTQFNEVAQPLYMFIDSNGEPLSMIKYGYDPDIQKFVNHLDAMKKEFESRMKK